MKRTISITLTLAALLVLSACAYQDQQEFKESARDTAQATKETGHFFRDNLDD